MDRVAVLQTSDKVKYITQLIGLGMAAHNIVESQAFGMFMPHAETP